MRARQSYKFLVSDWTALKDLQAASDVLGTMRFSRNLEPLELECPRADKILVIAPHPDDEILGPGGTLMRAIRAGAQVHCVYLTSGNSEALEDEARAIGELYGYGTTFLRFPLRAIPADEDALSRLADEIHARLPDCLFVPFVLDDHDDHRRANQLLMLMQRAEMIPGAPEIWGYQVYTALLPNVIVDITELREDKTRAIRMWSSQMQTRDWAHYMLGLNAFNSRFLKGKEGPRDVEGFFVLPLAEYADLCETYFKDTTKVYYNTPTYR